VLRHGPRLDVNRMILDESDEQWKRLVYKCKRAARYGRKEPGRLLLCPVSKEMIVRRGEPFWIYKVQTDLISYSVVAYNRAMTQAIICQG